MGGGGSQFRYVGAKLAAGGSYYDQQQRRRRFHGNDKPRHHAPSSSPRGADLDQSVALQVCPPRAAAASFLKSSSPPVYVWYLSVDAPGEGAAVGKWVGTPVGPRVGTGDGPIVGAAEGTRVG